MTTHPERRPAKDVEGALHLADLKRTGIEMTPDVLHSLQPLIAVLSRAAMRVEQERLQSANNETRSAA